MRTTLNTVGAAAAATIVGFVFSVGCGISDAYRAALMQPSALGVAPMISILVIAGVLAGASSGQRRLIVNLAVVYVGLVVGRLLCVTEGWADTSNLASRLMESFTLGFTISEATCTSLELGPDPLMLRVAGVLLQVLAVGAGVVVAKLAVNRRSTPARLA